MNFFSNCKTLEDLKEAYRAAAMQHHPDKGGDTATMQAINAEYTVMFGRLKNTHKGKDNAVYTSQEESTTEIPADLINIVNAVIRFVGVKIELIGRWLWITGNTREYKDELKKLGFRWSNNKMAWYFHKEPYHKRKSKMFSMDDIRAMWDSADISGEKQAALNA